MPIFQYIEYDPWMVHGKQKGEMKWERNFGFLKIFKAGHMVPMDQPEASLHLFEFFDMTVVIPP